MGAFVSTHLKSPSVQHVVKKQLLLKVLIRLVLVGGFNPFEKYYSSQIGSFPQIGVNIKKYLKPPPSWSIVGMRIFCWEDVHPFLAHGAPFISLGAHRRLRYSILNDLQE